MTEFEVTNITRGCPGVVYGPQWRVRCCLIPEHVGMCTAIDEQGNPVIQWRKDSEHDVHIVSA